MYLSGNRDDIFGMVDCVINCGASSNPTCRSREESYLYLPIVVRSLYVISEEAMKYCLSNLQ